MSHNRLFEVVNNFVRLRLNPLFGSDLNRCLRDDLVMWDGKRSLWNIFHVRNFKRSLRDEFIMRNGSGSLRNSFRMWDGDWWWSDPVYMFDGVRRLGNILDLFDRVLWWNNHLVVGNLMRRRHNHFSSWYFIRRWLDDLFPFVRYWFRLECLVMGNWDRSGLDPFSVLKRNIFNSDNLIRLLRNPLSPLNIVRRRLEPLSMGDRIGFRLDEL
jgi:hypothetical protein